MIVNPYNNSTRTQIVSDVGTTKLNPWFSFHNQNYSNKNETDLYKGMIQECISIRGLRMIYVPRTANIDFLFGEDVNSKFENGFEFAAWVKDFEGFQPGTHDVASKFGLLVRDSMEFEVARKEWDDLKKSNPMVPDQPREGDLIFFPTDGREILEISWVEDEEQFYPLSKQMTWKLRANAFQYSGEKVQSGFEQVDVVEDLTPSIDLNAILDNRIAQEISAPFKKFDPENPFGEF
jgi:hypothetical protein